MPKLTNSRCGILCSKGLICRFLLISSLFLLTYLLIYQFDISLPPKYTRTFLTTFINIDRSQSLPMIVPTVSVDTIISTTISKKIDTIVEVTTAISEMTSELQTTQNSNGTEQIKEAFVTFSNNQGTYLALLKILLDSVHAFSTRPIIAYGIDVDLDVDVKQYPRLIKRRISQKDCGPSVYFCKLHAIVSSNVEYGILMETDDVVNYNVDVLFDVLHVWPYPVPLSPRHPDDPQNYAHFMQQHNVSKRTTPYIHAHMIWTHRALPFLKNLQALLKEGHFQGANFDETGVNVMLWKAGANHTLCKYDPYFTYSDSYERWPTVTNCTRYCHTVFMTLHGSKEAKVSSELLTRLKTMVGKPTVQTLGMGGMKYINDTSVTCCYPDSKPSPIHPLLCEHSPSSF